MYERLKGFRDFFPEEMRARRQVIDTLESVARSYGFREIGTPALERTQLYLDKSGEEIIEQLYTFTDKGGREVALTPELTPTVARMVVDRGQALPKPIKWYSTRPFWRYEQVQQGRYREFYQINVDVIGSDEPDADAEILAFCADALVSLGLTASDFEFRVSHRDILGGLLESFDGPIDTRAGIRAVDKREKIPVETYHDLLQEAGLTRDNIEDFDAVLRSQNLEEVTEFAGTDRVTTAVDNLTDVLAAADDFGVRDYLTISLDTARGLDYYTGVVFECFDSTGDVSRSVFGGGRYDDLIESYGGPPTPAVGVAPGFATLSLLLQRAGAWPAETQTTDYVIVQAGDTRPVAADIARTLRERGNTVELDLNDRSVGRQLEYADTVNATTAVIVGERDLADDAVTLRDMTTGDQAKVPVTDFPGPHDHPRLTDYE